jgi:hypothetical protein
MNDEWWGRAFEAFEGIWHWDADGNFRRNALSPGLDSYPTQNLACYNAAFQTRFIASPQGTPQKGVTKIGHKAPSGKFQITNYKQKQISSWQYLAYLTLNRQIKEPELTPGQYKLKYILQ